MQWTDFQNSNCAIQKRDFPSIVPLTHDNEIFAFKHLILPLTKRCFLIENIILPNSKRNFDPFQSCDFSLKKTQEKHRGPNARKVMATHGSISNSLINPTTYSLINPTTNFAQFKIILPLKTRFCPIQNVWFYPEKMQQTHRGPTRKKKDGNVWVAIPSFQVP